MAPPPTHPSPPPTPLAFTYIFHTRDIDWNDNIQVHVNRI